MPQKTNKIENLREQIERFKHKSSLDFAVYKKNSPDLLNSSTNSAGAMIFNIAIELVSGVIVGVLVGNMLDRWLSSYPAFLITSILLSFAAVFKTIWEKYIK